MSVVPSQLKSTTNAKKITGMALKVEKLVFDGGSQASPVYKYNCIGSDGYRQTVSLFSESARQWGGALDVGRTYIFQKMMIRHRHSKFSDSMGDVDIVLDRFGIIRAADDRSAIGPQVKAQTRTLAQLVEKSGGNGDAILVVSKILGMTPYISAGGKKFEMFKLLLADDSAGGRSVEVACFDEAGVVAQQVAKVGAVLHVSCFSLRMYGGGFSGAIGKGSSVQDAGDLAEAARLREWWAALGEAEVTSISSDKAGRRSSAAHVSCTAFKTALRDMALDEVLSFKLSLSLQDIFPQGQAFFYSACGSMADGHVCNKELELNGDCARCGKPDDVHPLAYMPRGGCTLKEFASGALTAEKVKVTCFGQLAEKLLGLSAAELEALETACGRQHDSKRGVVVKRLESRLGACFEVGVDVVAMDVEGVEGLFYSVTAFSLVEVSLVLKPPSKKLKVSE
jgi:hypothetical protein